jgi:threonine aldolase
MMSCSVGNDQKGEDPTVNRLQNEVCALLGTEAAIFLPSAREASRTLPTSQRLRHRTTGNGLTAHLIATSSNIMP